MVNFTGWVPWGPTLTIRLCSTSPFIVRATLRLPASSPVLTTLVMMVTGWLAIVCFGLTLTYCTDIRDGLSGRGIVGDTRGFAGGVAVGTVGAVGAVGATTT